jgi:hypothetical protein
MGAEPLQWRAPGSPEAFVAARTITALGKNFRQCALVMTHAHHLPTAMTHVQPASAVLDDERFVAAVSCGHSPIAATVAGFSIVTTASPSTGIPGCSSAPSDALAENSFRIPSINTLGFVAAALLVSVGCCLGVDFSGDLIDLDWGSWEGSLPESSSLGGDGRPLRGAFFIDPTSSIRDSRTHCRKNFINFARLATFSSPSIRGGLALPGPPKWPILSPPPTPMRAISPAAWEMHSY